MLFTLLQGTCAQSLFLSFQPGCNGFLVACELYVGLSPKCFEMEQKGVFRVRNPGFYSWSI